MKDFRFAPALLLMTTIALAPFATSCDRVTKPEVGVASGAEIANPPAPPAPPPSPSSLVKTAYYTLANNSGRQMPAPVMSRVQGYTVPFRFLTLTDINNNTDDNQQWDVVGITGALQAGNAGSSVSFGHTQIWLPTGGRVEVRSMALHAKDSDVRTYDLPKGYKGWAFVSVARTYLPGGANDLSVTATTARVGRTLMAVAASGFGKATSTVVCDVYFVVIPDTANFEIVQEQPLVMHSGIASVASALPGSFALWQEYTTSASELSASILSSELQKKIRSVVPDNFVMVGVPGAEPAGTENLVVTPEQIAMIVAWSKQLWSVGVFVLKFLDSDPRDNDVSFRVTHTATAWSGRGVDGNKDSRAILQIYRIKVTAQP